MRLLETVAFGVADVTNRIVHLEGRVNDLDATVHQRFDSLARRIDALADGYIRRETFQKLEKRVSVLEH